ncbi:MAG: hypothetical protein HC842_05050 [Cytophagales bacterium]|nr:hypothetical protein [Cytophagales bacterium]
MTYKGTMDSALLITFLKRLIRDSDKKVLLVPDNLRVHHGKKLKQWLAEHKDEIEIFHLPPYS